MVDVRAISNMPPSESLQKIPESILVGCGDDDLAVKHYVLSGHRPDSSESMPSGLRGL
jgi:hypothetical protein